MKTRKNLIVLTLLFCPVLAANSQPGKFYAGFKAGAGIPNLTSGAKSTPLSENYKSRLGLYGGIISEFMTNDRFSLRAEINYSAQGGKREGVQALPLPAEMAPLWQMLPLLGITPDEYMYANIKSDAILNYLEIPFMAKFRFNLGSKLDFYLSTGPYMGILLNARNITSGSSSIYVDSDGFIPVDAILQLAEMPPLGRQSFDHDEDITGDVHRFNVGGQGAIGFGMTMGSGIFFLEGGGNYGFVPIQKDEANGLNHTGAGTITFGYLLKL